tara:strand:+ start:318 stop:509 length:192 start_codon:yes stop_codon:yes gene_type:complete
LYIDIKINFILLINSKYCILISIKNKIILGFLNIYAQVAQLVEQRTENPCVGGSNPPLGTLKK